MSNSQPIYKNEIISYKKKLNKIIEVSSQTNKIMKIKIKKKSIKKHKKKLSQLELITFLIHDP